MLTKKRRYRLCLRKTMKEVSLFHFPIVKGLEDVSERLQEVETDTVFSALLKAFSLRPIKYEKEAREAERVLEYIERAFENNTPKEVDDYRQVLIILIQHFDEEHYVRTNGNMEPHEFLRALLEEDGISQKELVPLCFKSESQVSEFLHQRKSRKNLSYEQAIALGKRFKVDPLNFLKKTDSL